MTTSWEIEISKIFLLWLKGIQTNFCESTHTMTILAVSLNEVECTSQSLVIIPSESAVLNASDIKSLDNRKVRILETFQPPFGSTIIRKSGRDFENYKDDQSTTETTVVFVTDISKSHTVTSQSTPEHVTRVNDISRGHIVASQLTPERVTRVNEISRGRIVTSQSAQEHITSVNDISRNHFNKINHELHDCLWCPCILYALYICCIPALIYMYKSDKRYRENLHQKAKLYANMSSILYGLGFICAIIIYSLIAYSVYYLNFVYKLET